MDPSSDQQRETLQVIARRLMLEHGLLPDYSPAALAELEKMQPPTYTASSAQRDLRDLLWASIDNDDSMDLDQVTVAAPLADDQI